NIAGSYGPPAGRSSRRIVAVRRSSGSFRRKNSEARRVIGRMMKWGAAVGVIALVIVSMYFIYLYRQIRDFAARDEARPADVIVVLGAAQYNGRPSPVLKARLDHALDLYNSRVARAIIPTGSYGPHPFFLEAEIGRKYLVHSSVRGEGIVNQQGSGSAYRKHYTRCAPLQARSL